jgi:hypothetical protein
MTSKPARALYSRLAILLMLLLCVAVVSAGGQEQPDYTGCGEPYYYTVFTNASGTRAEIDYSRACVQCNEGEVCYSLMQ